MIILDKKTFETKWKKAEKAANAKSSSKRGYAVTYIIVVLKDGTQLVTDNYEFIYDTAKEYYEDNNKCKYSWFKDGVYLENNSEYVAVVRLSNVKDIKISWNTAPTNDYFEVFDLCK